jgi:hypothetical protein
VPPAEARRPGTARAPRPGDEVDGSGAPGAVATEPSAEVAVTDAPEAEPPTGVAPEAPAVVVPDAAAPAPAAPDRGSPPAVQPPPTATDDLPIPAGAPVRIRIAAIGVDNPLTPVGLHPDRTLVVPDDERVAGWYTGAPRPGRVGPAVIAGHNAWNGRTGVFWDLRTLAPGAVVEVVHDTGEVVTFVVDRLEQHPKTAFPTQRVYGNTRGSELRIITCGGAFDSARGSHVDNVIVFATRTG